MKYDCTKTRDCLHEYHRLCDSHPAGCDNDCPFIEEYELCGFDIFESEDNIAALQKWSDEHPEPPKLTKREYEFLSAFAPYIESRAIERTATGLYITFHHAFNDEADGYYIDPNLFPFIGEGDEWYFDKLLGLEVKE